MEPIRLVSESFCTQVGDAELAAVIWVRVPIKAAVVFQPDDAGSSHTLLPVLFVMGENTIFTLSIAKPGCMAKKHCAIKPRLLQ